MMNAFYYRLALKGQRVLLTSLATILMAAAINGQSSFLPYEPEKEKLKQEATSPAPAGQQTTTPDIRSGDQEVILSPGLAGGTSYVQEVLKDIRETKPELVGQVEGKDRYYLHRAHASVVTKDQLKRLQEAYYLDVTATCKFYAKKYLLDWRVLVAKSARETFWGTSFLCAQTNNYFGIWQENKPWLCESFGFCNDHVRDDPHPTEFACFPSFEQSLWMFIHTIYSFHYRERLPDRGERIYGAIGFERTYGVHYWKDNHYAYHFADSLDGETYEMNHLIYSWSEHKEGFNLCVECTRDSDRKWVYQVMQTKYRLHQRMEEAAPSTETDEDDGASAGLSFYTGETNQKDPD